MSKLVLSKWLMAGTIATIILIVGIGIGHTITELRRFGGASSQSLVLLTSKDVQQAVNDYRVQNGMGALSPSGSLENSAQARADFLCNENKWSHDGWVDSLAVYKTTAVKVGENLQYGSQYQTPRTIVEGWANSPTHNANMLDSVYTEQGMGIRYCSTYQGEREIVIIVNHFGKP